MSKPPPLAPASRTNPTVRQSTATRVLPSAASSVRPSSTFAAPTRVVPSTTPWVPRSAASSATLTVRPSTTPAALTVRPSTASTVRPSSVSYVSPSGTEISIPSQIDPYEALGVTESESIRNIKQSFAQSLNTVHRFDRVVASLSYYMIMSKSDVFRKSGTVYEIANPNHFLFATVGDTGKLMAAISRNKSLLVRTNEHKHTVLYLAARSGYHDTTLALIKAGASVNHQQVDGSTPMHGASFYGQREIVEMLLEHGADPAIKNRFGCTPAEDARDESIKAVFEKFTEDNILKIIVPMLANGDAYKVDKIEYKGQLVAKQVHRKMDATLGATLKYWKVGWHGTKSMHLASIFKHGLKPSGTTLPSGEKIEPPKGHIPLGIAYQNVQNWSKAIFVSPSLLYASHGAYAEEIISEHKRWCVLVMARVKPGSYTAHPPTTSPPHEFSKDEPQDSEFRIPISGAEKDEDLVLRVELSSNVVVTSCVFISTSFLEDFRDVEKDMKYEDLEKLFHNT